MTLVTDLLGLEPEDKTLEFFLKSYNKRVPEIFFASAFPRLPVRQWVLSVPKRGSSSFRVEFDSENPS